MGANEEWSEPSLGRCMRERESRALLPDKRLVATYVQRVRYVTNADEFFPLYGLQVRNAINNFVESLLPETATQTQQ